MHPTGSHKKLFDAFSRIAAQAFVNPRMVSCHVLSKMPSYDDIARRYRIKAPIRRVSFLQMLELTLRHFCINAAHLLWLLLARFIVWRADMPMPLSRDSRQKTVVIDTFLVLHKVVERKRFTELYLPGLAEEAEQCGCRPVYFFRLYGSRNPRVLRRALSVLKENGVPALTELQCFTLTDWLALVKHLVVYPFAHWQCIRSLAHAEAESPEAYIRDALIHCLPQCYMIGEGRRLAARRLAAMLPDTSSVVTWYENQTVNKAFQLGLWEYEARGGRHTPTIGAQLMLWPPALINNHADDAEVPLHLTPDRVLVNGPHFLPDETTQHYQVGPSLRYGAIFENIPPPADEPPGDAGDAPGKPVAGAPGKPVLVLLSYFPQEVTRVLRFIQQAGCERQMVFKFHPATRMEDYRHLLPDNPTCVEGSLYSAARNASLIIGSGSGSLAEAAALGLPVIIIGDTPGTPGTDDAGFNYLPETGHGCLWLSLSTTTELPQAINTLEAYQHSPAAQSMSTRLRQELFTEPTPEAIRTAFELT